MRLLILSDSDSPHTIKWVRSIAGRNILVGVFSIHKTNLRLYENINNIKIYDLGISRKIQNKDEIPRFKLQFFQKTKIPVRHQ